MPKAASPFLAVLAGIACVVLSGLFFLGHSATGKELDLVPCLLTVCLVSVVVHVAGRLQGGLSWGLSAAFAMGGILLGKFLAWDLAGIVSATTGHETQLGQNGWETLQRNWNSLPPGLRIANLTFYLLTPCFAGGLVSACRWIGRHRLIAGKPPEQAPPDNTSPAKVPIQSARRWPLLLAVLWACTVIGGHLMLHQPDRTGFLAFSLPVIEANRANSMWGFAHLVKGAPVMAETIPAAEQVTWFSGQRRSDNNFRYLRAGYAWAAVTLLPFLEPMQSLITFNVLAWLASLTCVWLIAREMFQDDLTACFTTMLATVGSGYAFHWDAATPHLFSFALYSLGILMLLRTGIHSTPQPWPIHLALGLFLGLVSLVYNVWLMLAFVYVVSGFRKQNLLHMLGCGLVAVTFQAMWQCILPGLGINVVHVEGEYLQRALTSWAEAWKIGGGHFLLQTIRFALEAVTSLDSPVILLLGLAGLFTLKKEHRLFVFSGIIAPVLACTLFAPAAGARGYIVFGSSCLWFLAAGRLLALGVRPPGLIRSATILTLILALLLQVAWSTSILQGWAGPEITFLLGWDQGGALLIESSPEVISLTGRDAIPKLWGGHGTASTLHAYHQVSHSAPERSRILAWLSRWLFWVGGAALCCSVITHAWKRVYVVFGFVAFMLVLTEIALLMPAVDLAYWEMNQACVLNPGEALTTRIEVSKDVSQRLQKTLILDEADYFLYVPTTDDCQIRWFANHQEVSLSNPEKREARIANPSILTSPSEAVVWEVTLTNRSQDALRISGWQNRQTPGKTVNQPHAICLPALEIRVRDRRTGILKMLAF